MSYVDSNLVNEEYVVYRTQYSGIIFIPGIIIWAISMMVFGKNYGNLIIIFGISIFFANCIKKKYSEFAITNKRVIIKTGIISRQTVEMNLSKIESINVDQGIFGRIFNYGTITIVGSGATREKFKNISTPLDFRKCVQNQLT